MYEYYLAETALAITPTILYDVLKKMYPDKDNREKDTVTAKMNKFRDNMKQKPEELVKIYWANYEKEEDMPDRFPALFHPVFGGRNIETIILENKRSDTSATISENGNKNQRRNENFYIADIERIWVLSGLPAHITKYGKLSVAINVETKNALETYDPREVRQALCYSTHDSLYDKMAKILRSLYRSEKPITDLKTEIDNLVKKARDELQVSDIDENT
jgi:hypothetical protein